MKVLMINSVCGTGSTGRICTDIAKLLLAAGHECKIVYGRGSAKGDFPNSIRVGTDFSVKINALCSRLLDNEGFNAQASTKELVKIIKEYDPDLIHLHNLHGYFLNIPILFSYLKNEFRGKVLWNLYDCWSFTGHCAHFDFVKCDQWESGCLRCAYKHRYPKSIGLSNAKTNYIKKKKYISGIDNLSIVVPSKWLDKVVSRSFLKEYTRRIMPNGINLDNFYPVEKVSKSKWGIDENKFIILGVSSFWTETKGVEYFIKLARDISQTQCQIVLVGNIHETKLPSNILHIPATNDIKELCELYTAADVFVNPTLQETQGLTTIEAFACGTPAIVFNSGGAAECVDDTCGIIVEKNNYEQLRDSILRVQNGEVKFDSQSCINVAQKYDTKKLYYEFIKLYESIVKE